MIAIIGILIGLLIPAVLAAREAARRVECSNHLKQLALAFQLHVDTVGFFPTGGWGWRGGGTPKSWCGVPGRGYGKRQPGGWGYTTLPFLDQLPLHRVAPGNIRVKTPLSIHYCPTRRAAILYPNTQVKLMPDSYYLDVAVRAPVAKSDYAANLGYPHKTCCHPAPRSIEETEQPGWRWPVLKDHQGISYAYSQVRLRHVTDGTSNTYMIGEKHLSQVFYTNGLSGGDDGPVYASHNSDTHRSTMARPHKDKKNAESRADGKQIFGSAHPSGFNMAFCDGSAIQSN